MLAKKSGSHIKIEDEVIDGVQSAVWDEAENNDICMVSLLNENYVSSAYFFLLKLL